MGWIFAVAILWLVFGRWRGRMWSGRACVGRMHGGGWRGQAGRRHARQHLPVLAVGEGRSRGGVPREAALESLKRRYVTGELSDEQYERELDTLFRATSGRGRA
jgi:hypothetical protein